MRLQVFLSHNGVCSRRDAMIMIQSKRVCVNGQIIIEPSFSVDGKEAITVDGKNVILKSLTYIMLNKPVGYTTTKDDPHAKRIIMELLPKDYQHLMPVGRLDRDSSGLILLTNDGNLAFKLTHPSFHQKKTYHVILSGTVNKQKIDQLQRGIVIKEDAAAYKTAPCQITDIVVQKLSSQEASTAMTIILSEGRKRQIRMMAKAIGHHVISLHRISVGPLLLGNLPSGEWCHLTMKEVKELK